MSARRYDPAAVRAACRIIEPGPVGYDELPLALHGDADLERNIDARWGCAPDTLRFRLLEIRVGELYANLPEDLHAHYAHILRHGLAYYQQLERGWQQAFAHQLEEAGAGADPFELDNSYPDGDRRYTVACAYRDQFAGGESVTPIVVDFDNLAGFDGGGVDVLDGTHRIAGALVAGADIIRLYEVLPD